ncbi:MAG TPA: glutamine--fructose-6-phosphate transaminase (isomerizing) [Thermoplasmata archaeon]
MCGIIGYAGYRQAYPILLDGLKRLEYRGYDSAGVAIVGSGLQVVKDKGYIAHLEETSEPVPGVLGIGHTRWATHGPPSKENAHPHIDCAGEIALVHNGIIENHAELRERLEKAGHVFRSQTDTETAVHLIESHYKGDLEAAVREAIRGIEGSYAIAVIHAKEPDQVVAARNESPLVIGLGTDENFLASDIPALLKHTNRVVYVMDREIVVLSKDGVKITDFEGRRVAREPQRITWSLEDAEKGGFEHFMLKEIFEEPQAIHDTLLGRVAEPETDSFFKNGYTNIKLVACGTSYHAALVGKYVLEEIARVPTTAELASEYRYSRAPADRPIVILISQSGETADTLGACREANRRGCKTFAIVNVIGSSLAREASRTMLTRAGIEIGVAATKTFVAQLAALYLLAIRIGLERGTLGVEEANRLNEELRRLPRAVQAVLNEAPYIEGLAQKYAKVRDMFFIGRHLGFPIAMEGALKLKEISYIHAEAYAAGELKHGPLALVGPETPVVAIAVRDSVYEKLLSNVREVDARGAPVLAIGTEGDKELRKFVDDVVYVPATNPLFAPVPVVVALQLFAYHVARVRGCSIDKPRNLAKSVTVE